MENINKELVAKYKHIVSAGNEKELYKWQLVEKFKGKPDTNAVDFAAEFSQVSYGNLIYQMANAVRLHLLKQKPEEYRQIVASLFDESQPLKERIVSFQKEIADLYKSTGATLHHHHDERTIATFLAFKYPEKYPLYKSGIYTRLLQNVGRKTCAKK